MVCGAKVTELVGWLSPERPCGGVVAGEDVRKGRRQWFFSWVSKKWVSSGVCDGREMGKKVPGLGDWADAGLM